MRRRGCRLAVVGARGARCREYRGSEARCAVTGLSVLSTTTVYPLFRLGKRLRLGSYRKGRYATRRGGARLRARRAALVIGVLAWTLAGSRGARVSPAAPSSTRRIGTRHWRGCSGPHRRGPGRRRLPSVPALVAAVAGGALVGIVLWMIRANAGLARYDLGAAHWGASNASTGIDRRLRTISLLGGTLGSILIAVLVAAVVARQRVGGCRCAGGHVPGCRDGRPGRPGQLHQGGRRPGPSGHRPADRVLRDVVPLRSLRHERRGVRGGRPAPRLRARALHRAPC